MEPTRRYQMLYFVFFAAFSGFAAFRNVFLQEIGMTGVQMGLVGALWVAGGVVAQPIWGVVADYTQSPTRVLLFAAAFSGLAILSYPLGAALPAHAFLAIAAGTLAFSMTRAPIVPVANSLVLRQGVSYGRVRSYGSIAFGVSVLVVGYVLAWVSTILIVYLYAAGMVVLVLLLRGVPRVEEQVFDGGLGARALGLVRDPGFIVVLAAAFVMGAVSTSGAAFFSVYMRAVGLGDGYTGLAWMLKTVVEAVLFVRLARGGWPAGGAVAVGGASYAVAYALYTTWSTLPSVLFANLFLGAGVALVYSALVPLAHESAPDGLHSTAQTLLTSVGIGAGGALGQSVTGYLVDLVGVQAMYAYLGAAALALVLLGAAVHVVTTGDPRAGSPA